MKRYALIGIGIVVIAGALYVSYADRDTDTESKRSDSNQSATEPTSPTQTSKSDFDRFASASLVDYQGNSVSLAELKGKPLVINSWAVWCPFCVKELPTFAELQKEFGDRVTVIAIDRQEPLAKAKGFTDGLGITGDITFLLDSSDSFYRSIGGFSMPETIFVNSAGEIVVHKRGPMELEEMRGHVQRILKDG